MRHAAHQLNVRHFVAQGFIGRQAVTLKIALKAFEKGLRAGDIITEAGQEKIASIADLNARMDAAREAGRKSLLLLIRRAGEPRFVALSLS